MANGGSGFNMDKAYYLAISSHVDFTVTLSQKLAQIIIFVIKHRSK